MVSGIVLKSKRVKDRTEIEVLQIPTGSGAMPKKDRARSQGRFLAVKSGEFLDPAVVDAGTPVTVVGEVGLLSLEVWIKANTPTRFWKSNTWWTGMKSIRRCVPPPTPIPMERSMYGYPYSYWGPYGGMGGWYGGYPGYGRLWVWISLLRPFFGSGGGSSAPSWAAAAGIRTAAI